MHIKVRKEGFVLDVSELCNILLKLINIMSHFSYTQCQKGGIISKFRVLVFPAINLSQDV